MRPLSESDVRRIAEEVAKQVVKSELKSGFDRADLLNAEREPDWKRLAPLAETDWDTVEALTKAAKAHASLKEEFVRKYFLWIMFGALGWMGYNAERILTMIASAIAYLKGGQP